MPCKKPKKEEKGGPGSGRRRGSGSVREPRSVEEVMAITGASRELAERFVNRDRKKSTKSFLEKGGPGSGRRPGRGRSRPVGDPLSRQRVGRTVENPFFQSARASGAPVATAARYAKERTRQFISSRTARVPKKPKKRRK